MLSEHKLYHWVDSEDFIAEMEMLRLQVMLQVRIEERSGKIWIRQVI